MKRYWLVALLPLVGCSSFGQPKIDFSMNDLKTICSQVSPCPECTETKPVPPETKPPEVIPPEVKPPETPPVPPVTPPGVEPPVPPSDNKDKPEGVLLAPPTSCDPGTGKWLIDATGKCGKWSGKLTGPGWEPRAWPGTLAGQYHYLTRMATEKENGTEQAVFTGLCRGKCSVWAGYFAGENRARNCVYKIKTKDSKEYTVTINQHEGRTSYGPRWVRLGAWNNVRSVTLINGPDHSESIDGLALIQDK